MLLEKSYLLIDRELTLTHGIIGGPPPVPPTILQFDDIGLPSGRLRLLQSDRVRAFKLVADLDNAKRQKDATKAQVSLIELHDILVTRNANLDPNDPKAPQRTMSDDDLKGVLERLQPLAHKDGQATLVLPSQLKNKTPTDFQGLFLPFQET